jgi:hypothetical protein
VAIRITLSLFCAGVFYFAWMAVFLLTASLDSSAIRTLLWFLAPVVTAAGFATGILASERLSKADRSKPLHLFTWPLVGCAIGAGVVFWFGPMLIVFGMIVAGTASIVLREVILITNKTRTSDPP